VRKSRALLARAQFIPFIGEPRYNPDALRLRQLFSHEELRKRFLHGINGRLEAQRIDESMIRH
jgi:hypothetical protein